MVNVSLITNWISTQCTVFLRCNSLVLRSCHQNITVYERKLLRKFSNQLRNTSNHQKKMTDFVKNESDQRKQDIYETLRNSETEFTYNLEDFAGTTNLTYSFISEMISDLSQIINSAKKGHCSGLNNIIGQEILKKLSHSDGQNLIVCNLKSLKSSNDSFGLEILENLYHENEFKVHRLNPYELWHKKVKLNLRFNPQFPIIAIYNETFMATSSSQLAECQRSDEKYYCPRSTFLSLDSNSCEHHLFYQQTKQAIEICSKLITGTEQKRFQKSKYFLSYQNERLLISCPENQTSLALEYGLYHLRLRPDCLAQVNGHYLKTHILLQDHQQYHLSPKLAQNLVNLLTKAEETQILSTDRNKIEHLIKIEDRLESVLELLSLETAEELIFLHLTLLWSTMILTLITFVLVFLICYFTKGFKVNYYPNSSIALDQTYVNDESHSTLTVNSVVP